MTQAQNNYPPKLNFLPNTPVQVYFTYGDYKMIPSKNKDWSESYKYNVEVNDVTHTLFATPGLHRELQIRSIGQQCYVLITKAVELDENNKEITRWSVLNADGSERPAVEFTPEPPAASPAAPSAPQTPPAAPQPQGAVMAAPGSREDARLVWRSCVTLMGVCIEQAQKIYTDAGYEIEKRVEAHDIHATATTLFIQVSRATDPTLLLKPEQAAAPAPAPPPQPQPQQQAAPPPQEPPANPTDDDLPF
jgi:pyruvate/2-oxoglutarate dehydrogenase complex dihydrolipoamide acyltransferase (E2) component